MKQNQIILFGGGSDGQKITANEDAKQAVVAGEKYHIVHEYKLAFTEEVASKANCFHYVFNEMLETYSLTRTGGDMQAAKAALKKRVSGMRTLVPAIGFFIVTTFCFFLLEKFAVNYGLIFLPGALYAWGFHAGFVEIKNRIKRL